MELQIRKKSRFDQRKDKHINLNVVGNTSSVVLTQTFLSPLYSNSQYLLTHPHSQLMAFVANFTEETEVK